MKDWLEDGNPFEAPREPNNDGEDKKNCLTYSMLKQREERPNYLRTGLQKKAVVG